MISPRGRNAILTATLMTCLTGAAFAQKPLAVKTGLWEITRTTQMSGAMALPPDLLAKMTPEQRARIEAVQKAHAERSAQSHVSKSCVKKEDLDKGFGKDQTDNCKWNLTTSTATKQEGNVECNQEGVTRKGTVMVEALSSESIEMNVHMMSSNGTDKGSVDMQLTGKWLGPTCSEKDEE